MKKPPDHLTPFGLWLWSRLPHWYGRNFREWNISKGLHSPRNKLWFGRRALGMVQS
jgi:hypothetical protein